MKTSIQIYTDTMQPFRIESEVAEILRMIASKIETNKINLHFRTVKDITGTTMRHISFE